jgi:cell wall-associated NlpC family hydrolase
MGAPHRLGGLDRSGIDCSGFTRRMYEAVAGIALPHQAAQQIAYGEAVNGAQLLPGDLLFFSEPGKGVFHVGLSLGGDQFVHASTRRGVTISSLREAYYAARFCGGRRLVR